MLLEIIKDDNILKKIAMNKFCRLKLKYNIKQCYLFLYYTDSLTLFGWTFTILPSLQVTDCPELPLSAFNSSEEDMKKI